MHGGGLNLFRRIAAIGLEALCDLSDQTEDVVRIAFKKFTNDRILSERSIGRETMAARNHRHALAGGNGTPQSLSTLCGPTEKHH
jgi:hypothetical protein